MLIMWDNRTRDAHGRRRLRWAWEIAAQNYDCRRCYSV